VSGVDFLHVDRTLYYLYLDYFWSFFLNVVLILQKTSYVYLRLHLQFSDVGNTIVGYIKKNLHILDHTFPAIFHYINIFVL
jgi:hypothetical protein